MKIGIIGLGRAGRLHLDAWRLVEGAEVTAIADSALAVRRSVRGLGMRAYADPMEMLARESLDAVTIAAPPVHHAALTLACLERGIDVLCEKPLAVNRRAALKMLQTATRQRRQVQLATKFRHVPDVVHARELIAEGTIGEPVAFEIDFSSMVDMSGRWNCHRAFAGGGVIIDNGCHAFDIVAFLFGTVSRVHATRLKQLQNIEVEDSATILVAAGRGLIGRIDLSWSLATARETYITIYGSKGTIEIGWRGSRLKLPGKLPKEIGTGYDKNEAHRLMLGAFRDLARGNGQPWISPGEILRTVAAVEAAYRSLRLGSWVQVDMSALRELPARRAARIRA